MKSILIPVADGTEELEAVTLIDVLRRANMRVTVASVAKQTVTGAHQIPLTADRLIHDCINESFDGIFLPGGMPGATHLAASKELGDMLKTQASSGKFYGAICASPAVVLAPLGLLDNKLATAYPGFESKLPNQEAAAQKVVVDGNCITAQSPGVAQDFALQIIGSMLGAAKSQEIRVDLAA